MSNWILWGALVSAHSVIAGAFGAHALAEKLDPKALALWETAARYAMYGGHRAGAGAALRPLGRQGRRRRLVPSDRHRDFQRHRLRARPRRTPDSRCDYPDRRHPDDHRLSGLRLVGARIDLKSDLVPTEVIHGETLYDRNGEFGRHIQVGGRVDITELRQAVRTAGQQPLRAIGSGGSLTAAHALASLHQRFAGRIAAVATPLEATREPVDSGVATWLLSAGGGNVDILAAARVLIAREPRQLVVLCGDESSPLAELCRAYPFVDLLLFRSPSGKDGFLATNSLLGFITLLERAYSAEFATEAQWTADVEAVEHLLVEDSSAVALWKRETESLWSRPTTLVLFGPSTRIGAIDLESKFSEAALGNLQLADYRNFAHGRHHWLAKHGNTSAILAFATADDRILAEKTLALIPSEIPRACLEIPGPAGTAPLSSLVAAFRVSGWAGEVRGIDPGRPGVPEFGRKLYNLPLPRPVSPNAVTGLSEREAAAIKRKAGLDPHRLNQAGELAGWHSALNEFRTRIETTVFSGVVLDYDGTVVDTRQRFSR